MEEFDPYHKWLSIPKRFRPPTHYHLLGVDPEETDADVIDEAAVQRSSHLRNYQIGNHAALATRLLTEVAQARITLLNSAKRKAYDESLRQKTAKPAPSELEFDEVQVEDRVAAGAATPRPARSKESRGKDVRNKDARGEPSPQKPSFVPWIVGLGVGGGVLVVALVVVMLMSFRGEPVKNPVAVVPPKAKGPKGDAKDVVKDGKAIDVDPPKIVLEPPGPCEAHKLKRSDIPKVTLANAAGGDPQRVPPEVVGIFGDGRFRYPDAPAHIPAYSRDGKWLAVPTGSEVHVFDAATGQVHRIVRMPPGRTFGPAFASNGLLIVGSSDRTARVWDVTTGIEKLVIGGFEGTIHNVAVHPDASEIALISESADDDDLRIHRLSDGGLIRRLPGHFHWYTAAYSPSGKWLAALEKNGTMSLWDTKTGALSTWKVPLPIQEPGKIDFSPDEELLALGANDGARVYRIKESVKDGGAGALAYRTEGTSFFVNFTPDGKELITGGRGAPKQDIVRIRNASTGAGARSVPFPYGWDWLHATMSPDGQTLACCPHYGRAVQMYNLATRKHEVPSTGHASGIGTIAFSPNGKWLASGEEAFRVIVWNVSNGKQVCEVVHTSRIMAVEFSADSKVLAVLSEDGAIRLWDPTTGAHCGDYFGGSTNGPHRLAASPDGKSFAVGGVDGTVRLISAESGTSLQAPLHALQGSVRSVGFSKDGRLIAAGGENGKIVVLERGSGKVVAAFVGKAVVAQVQFGDTNRHVFASYDLPQGGARRWDVKTGESVQTFVGHGSHVNGLQIRADGRLLATCGDADGTVRLWDTASESPRPVTFGPELFGGNARDIAMSHDGAFLAVAARNGLVYVLRLPDPKTDLAAWMSARQLPRKLPHDQWLARVAKLGPGDRAQEVSNRLRELNTGADGVVTPTVHDGKIVEAVISTKDVHDISPLAALPDLVALSLQSQNASLLKDISPLKGLKLKRIDFGWAPHPIKDLSALEGMPLERFVAVNHSEIQSLKSLTNAPIKEIYLWGAPIEDLSFLQGQKMTHLHVGSTRLKSIAFMKDMPLQEVNIAFTGDDSLGPLRGAPLRTLSCAGTRIADLGPIEGAPLRELNFADTRVSDLGPLRKMMTLRNLTIGGSAVTDLSPLEGLTLDQLDMRRSKVTDLAPLAKVSVRHLLLDFNKDRDVAILRTVRPLERINEKPATEFWKGVDASP